MLDNEREAGTLAIGCFLLPLVLFWTISLTWSGDVGFVLWIVLMAIGCRFASSLHRSAGTNYFAKRKRASHGLRSWFP